MKYKFFVQIKLMYHMLEAYVHIQNYQQSFFC